MLEPAIKYKEQLEQLNYDIWFKDKYKYWNYDPYYSTIEVSTDTWNKHQFVSVKDGQVIGYIAYNVLRTTNSVNALSIVNFTDDKVTFGKDLAKALKDIFFTFNFRKIVFSVVIGNPAEKMYDKIIKKYGGRIVGIYKDDVKLMDGMYYDKKVYEITATEYVVNSWSN